jgi:hypothetical protein
MHTAEDKKAQAALAASLRETKAVLDALPAKQRAMFQQMTRVFNQAMERLRETQQELAVKEDEYCRLGQTFAMLLYANGGELRIPMVAADVFPHECAVEHYMDAETRDAVYKVTMNDKTICYNSNIIN